MDHSNEGMPEPLEMKPNEALDTVFRLRSATRDIRRMAANEPHLYRLVYQRLRAAWLGKPPYEEI